MTTLLRSAALLILTALASSAALSSQGSVQTRQTFDWPQWGGPGRDFIARASGLAAAWPAQGPRRLWSRALGQGHSAISTDGVRLYTLYRPAPGGNQDEEVVIALDAETGSTIWEHRFASPMAGAQFGTYIGPHSTPLVTADRVFAAGSRKQLFSLDRATGKVIWSRNLIKEYGAPEGDRGYAASPLLYRDLLIVSVGGPDQALAAFNAATGALVWKSGDYQHSPASPLLIRVGDQDHVAYLAGNAVAGFDPATGRVLWSYPHSTSASLNISTPVWSEADRLLFVSAGYGTGSRMIELRSKGDRTIAIQRWFNNRVRIHFGNAVRVGSHIVGSSGDFGPMFLTALDVQTGAIAWQNREFARAQLVVVDGKLLVLDEEGDVGLAAVSGQGLQVLSRKRILEPMAWTPPSLAGTRMFVRDRKTIAAYDLRK